MNTSGSPIESFTQNAPSSIKVYLPLVVLPMPQTIFGAFLDAPTSDNGLAQMMSADASWIHLPFSWSAVEPQAGVRNWAVVSSFEKLLRTATSHQINIIIYIQDTPGWALKAGYTCGAVAQNKFPDLGRFLTDLVARYSAPSFNVKYYELWSEPEVSGFLGCWGDPSDLTYYGGGYYGEMLKMAYPAIKAASPSAQVLFGGLLLDCNPAICNSDVKKRASRFMEGALVNGAGNFFDGVSFHGYDYYLGVLGQYYNPGWSATWNTTGPAFLAKADYLRQLLAQYHVSGKYLINTELAVLCGRTGLEAPCVTEDHQKTLSIYIVQAYAAGIADGMRANVWFSVAGWRGTALLDGSLKPLPSYTAFKNASDRLGKASYARSITEFTSIRGYEFNEAGHRIWVLWSVTAEGNPHTVSLGSLPVAVYDMAGNSLSPSDSLDVGLEPVYVEFES